jgi:hypothetical protein
MLEKDSVIILANKILDRPSGDPDDDLAVLSRQLLRREERLQRIIAYVGNERSASGPMLHIAKIARGHST